MDLKTGDLLWPALTQNAPGFGRLEEDCRCEVAIIGGGITGALMAVALAEEGIETVVVDRRKPGMGSTAACTALVLYEIDQPLVQLEQDVGTAHARRAYRATRRALDDLAEVIARYEIDCGLKRRGSLYLAKKDKDVDWFAEEIEARRQIGIEVELILRDELEERFGLRRPGAIHSPAAWEVDPYRLTLGLLENAAELGVRVFQETDAEPEDLSEHKQVLRASKGARIVCDRVVIATGYETPEEFRPVGKYCKLHSTYVLASEPLEEGIEPWADSMVIWETGDPYLYARRAGKRVIVGGADEPFSDAKKRDTLIEKKIGVLMEQFSTLCPGIRIIPERVWAGTFATTEDGLPYIGTLRQWPGCRFALGYGGNGLTFSMLAAQIISDDILGRDNIESELFQFDRDGLQTRGGHHERVKS